MQSAIRCPYFQKAFGWCVPIGGLAGLVGLGGGEFRLPVMMYVVGYPARTAVPIACLRRCRAEIVESRFPADFGNFIAEDTEKWGKVIQAAKISVD